MLRTRRSPVRVTSLAVCACIRVACLFLSVYVCIVMSHAYYHDDTSIQVRVDAFLQRFMKVITKQNTKHLKLQMATDSLDCVLCFVLKLQMATDSLDCVLCFVLFCFIISSPRRACPCTHCVDPQPAIKIQHIFPTHGGRTYIIAHERQAPGN